MNESIEVEFTASAEREFHFLTIWKDALRRVLERHGWRPAIANALLFDNLEDLRDVCGMIKLSGFEFLSVEGGVALTLL
jgi:hypothetical protein